MLPRDVGSPKSVTGTLPMSSSRAFFSVSAWRNSELVADAALLSSRLRHLKITLYRLSAENGWESESEGIRFLGIFETMYDDSPNFQIQIKELGRDKWAQIQEQRRAEEQRSHAKRLQRLSNVNAVEGDTGSGWSAAPAGADLSAPDQGVAGVMVAAAGSLQESGFAARRATSRLKEMQTAAYLEAASRRRESMQSTTL